MAKQNITLDELLTAIKGVKVQMAPTYLYGKAYLSNLVGNGTYALADSIENYDFITIEAGDESMSNPDNSNGTFIPGAGITYNMRYTTVGYGLTNGDHYTEVYSHVC